MCGVVLFVYFLCCRFLLWFCFVLFGCLGLEGEGGDDEVEDIMPTYVRIFVCVYLSPLSY